VNFSTWLPLLQLSQLFGLVPAGTSWYKLRKAFCRFADAQQRMANQMSHENFCCRHGTPQRSTCCDRRQDCPNSYQNPSRKRSRKSYFGDNSASQPTKNGHPACIQQESAHVKEELRLYRIQFETAEIQSTLARQILREVQERSKEAEVMAESMRTWMRKFEPRGSRTFDPTYQVGRLVWPPGRLKKNPTSAEFGFQTAQKMSTVPPALPLMS